MSSPELHQGDQTINLHSLLETYYDRYLAAGQYDEAIAFYCELLGYQPDLQGYHELGVYLAEQEEWDDAIACFLHSIQLDSEFFEGYYNLGVCLQEQGNYLAASCFYQQAVNLKPDAHAYFCLGSCLAEADRLHDAIPALINATQVDPHSPLAYKKLGDILTNQGKLTDAKICYSMHLPFSLLQDWQPASCGLWLSPHLDSAKAGIKICFPSQNSALEAHQTSLDHYGDRLETDALLDIPDGRILCYETDLSIIATATGQIIPSISLANGNWLNYWKTLPPIHHVDARVVYLSVVTGSIFFHWMFDILPKFELLTRMGIDLATIDYFIVTAVDRPFQLETLSLLNIPAHKLLPNSNYPHIAARQLIVPHLASRITPEGCEFLRQQFLPLRPARLSSVSELPSRLYITRRSAKTRNVLNESELITYLERLGFYTIELESMPFLEQVTLMSHATAVVGVHGSGLTNIVFCNPDTCVVELFSPNYMTSYYGFVSKQVGLRYFCLVGDSADQRQPEDFSDLGYMWEDMVIDITALQDLLAFAGL